MCWCYFDLELQPPVRTHHEGKCLRINTDDNEKTAGVVVCMSGIVRMSMTVHCSYEYDDGHDDESVSVNV